jgi:hypothetical protein
VIRWRPISARTAAPTLGSVRVVMRAGCQISGSFVSY